MERELSALLARRVELTERAAVEENRTGLSGARYSKRRGDSMSPDDATLVDMIVATATGQDGRGKFRGQTV